jgi:hypothetical protein
MCLPVWDPGVLGCKLCDKDATNTPCTRCSANEGWQPWMVAWRCCSMQSHSLLVWQLCAWRVCDPQPAAFVLHGDGVGSWLLSHNTLLRPHSWSLLCMLLCSSLHALQPRGEVAVTDGGMRRCGSMDRMYQQSRDIAAAAQHTLVRSTSACRAGSSYEGCSNVVYNSESPAFRQCSTDAAGTMDHTRKLRTATGTAGANSDVQGYV